MSYEPENNVYLLATSKQLNGVSRHGVIDAVLGSKDASRGEIDGVEVMSMTVELEKCVEPHR